MKRLNPLADRFDGLAENEAPGYLRYRARKASSRLLLRMQQVAGVKRDRRKIPLKESLKDGNTGTSTES